MKHTQTLILAIAILLTVGVTLLAVHKWETHKAAAQPVSLTGVQLQLKQERATAKQLATQNATQAAQLSQLTDQKGHLCGVLQAHKLADALCTAE